ncbi:hypothetical protein ACKAV7_003653 [Fusarium commune]
MADNSPQHPAATATTQPEGHLEVDDNLDANDSLYHSTIGGEIYAYENGRRYHAFREGTYPVPNDEDEQDRMDLVHHVYSILLDGKLHLAPIDENPQRVLDLGTGTGIWAIDFADEHPSAEVIGNDLSPIQPEWNPPNCTFEVDDYEDEWLYRTEFDFIHARELEACVGDEDLMLQRAFRHIRSNGYVELQGVDARFESDDGTLDKGPNAKLWMKHLIEACAKFGKPVDCADKWKDRLIKAGFVDVQQEVRKLPIGPWPKDPKLKELGRYQAIQESKVIDSYTPKLFEYALGWSADEIQVLMAQVKNELRDPAIHLYLPVYFVWGGVRGSMLDDEFEGPETSDAHDNNTELLRVLKPRKVTALQSWAGKLKEILSSLDTKVNQLSDGVQNMRFRQLNKEHQAILDWLIPVDYGAQQSDYFGNRQKGTGQWLLESTEHRDWRVVNGKTLFCPGIPVAGKTIPSSIIINDLHNKLSGNPSIGIGYIYCNFRRQKEQNINDLLASLLKQLSRSWRCLPESVKLLYDKHEKNGTRPLVEKLSAALQSVVQSYEKVFIVIDALDECQTLDDCRGKLLSEIFRLQSRFTVNFCATDRLISQ